MDTIDKLTLSQGMVKVQNHLLLMTHSLVEAIFFTNNVISITTKELEVEQGCFLLP